jgi:hypothetical protein
MTEGQKSHACSLESDQIHAAGSRFQEFCLIDYSQAWPEQDSKYSRP